MYTHVKHCELQNENEVLREETSTIPSDSDSIEGMYIDDSRRRSGWDSC